MAPKTLPSRLTSVCNTTYCCMLLLTPLFNCLCLCVAVGGGFGLGLVSAVNKGGVPLEQETTDRQEPTVRPTHNKPTPESDAPQETHEIQKEDGMQWVVRHKPADCHKESNYGDRLEVHYTGFLENGIVFDSSINNQRPPIGFTLGARQVIAGWEKGMKGMCVGEKRRLIIPPHLAYGDAGYPPSIPPRAKLLFEVTLMGLQKMNVLSNQIDRLVNILKMIGPPLVLLYIVYYLRKRYTAEQLEMKEEKKKTKKHK